MDERIEQTPQNDETHHDEREMRVSADEEVPFDIPRD